MAGRAYEREATALGGRGRGAGGEQRRLETRLGGERVAVEPGRLRDRPDPLDVLLVVAARDRLDRRRPDLVVLEGLEQNREPFRRLGMARRRMQARERRMAQDVDRRTASASLSRDAPS